MKIVFVKTISNAVQRHTLDTLCGPTHFVLQYSCNLVTKCQEVKFLICRAKPLLIVRTCKVKTLLER